MRAASGAAMYLAKKAGGARYLVTEPTVTLADIPAQPSSSRAGQH